MDGIQNKKISGVNPPISTNTKFFKVAVVNFPILKFLTVIPPDPEKIFPIFAAITANVASAAVETPFAVIALATSFLPSLTDFFRSCMFTPSTISPVELYEILL